MDLDDVQAPKKRKRGVTDGGLVTRVGQLWVVGGRAWCAVVWCCGRLENSIQFNHDCDDSVKNMQLHVGNEWWHAESGKDCPTIIIITCMLLASRTSQSVWSQGVGYLLYSSLSDQSRRG